MNLDRRRFIAGASTSLGIAGAVGVLNGSAPPDRRTPESRVAVIEADCYDESLEASLLPWIQQFIPGVRGRSVLLKPNLVEDLPGPVNTDARLIGAAARCFLSLGARQVTVAEGPGHQRDTEAILISTGLGPLLDPLGLRFIDLNRDALSLIHLKTAFSGLNHLWLPQTLLTADIVVSMPKVKTHHWAGATLSLKNLFGVVPGAKYGWPKNILHWHGIDRSIVDIAATVPIHLVIADGIVAMEGDGPLLGTARHLNRIVISDDPVAADATCARLMGLEPARIGYLKTAGGFLGNVDATRIRLVGGAPSWPREPFRVLPSFRHLVLRGKTDV